MACAPTLTGPLAAEPTALPNEQAARAATLPVTPSSPRLPRSLMHSPCCSRCWHAGQVEHGRPASLCVRCLHRLAARASAALPPPGGHAPQCHQRRAHPAPARPPRAGARPPRRRAHPAPAGSPRDASSARRRSASGKASLCGRNSLLCASMCRNMPCAMMGMSAFCARPPAAPRFTPDCQAASSALCHRTWGPGH